MGDILDLSRFKDARIASSDGPAGLSGGEAEIVFFPGVRVERQTVDLSVRHQHRSVGIGAAGAKNAERNRSRGFPVDQT